MTKLHTFVILEMNGNETPEVIGHYTNINVANAECAIMQRLNADRTFCVIVLPSAKQPMRHE